MRSHHISRTNVLSKVGFTRKKRRTRQQIGYRRTLRFEQVEDRRMLALMVTTTADAPENTQEAVGTLRQAIFDANQFPDHDTINFDPAFFNEPKTILLTEGQLNISESVTIEGKDPDGNLLGITIDASGNDPTPGVFDGNGSTIFSITNGHVVLDSVTLTGASDVGPRGGAMAECFATAA
jgi:hypothetical protein